MQKKILEFTNILRKSGIRVSTAEAIDAFQALDELSIEDRAIFRDALRTTMVKRGEEVPTYDELFDLYWSGFYDNLRETFGDAAASLAGLGIDLEELLKRIAQQIQGMQGDPGELSELARAMLTADLSVLEQLIRAAAEQAGSGRIENFLQLGFFSRRTLEQMGAEGAIQELRDLAARLEAAGMSPEEVGALRRLIDALMEAARKAVRAFTERELQKQNHDYMEKFRRETLLEKSFYHLTEDEIRKMREVVERLAQKIKNILSIRRRRLKRGKLDLHQTLRRNMSHGGIPFELVFKQRKKDRPKLVILCDISSSVANVSRFMLQFVYSLQEAFTKIRAFVFVAELGEVTHVLQEGEIGQAIEKVLEGGRRDQRLHPLQLRARLPPLLAELPVGGGRQDHGADPGRRPQQLQRSAGLVPARHAHQGEERGLAQPREPERLGLRRQRDGQVPALHRRRRGMPQPAPAQRDGGPADPLRGWP